MADYGICGKCEREYDTENGYLNHECPVTGVKPTNPLHHGSQFVRQSINAMLRGDYSEDDEQIQEMKNHLENGDAEKVKLRINHMQELGEIPDHVPDAPGS